MSEINITRRNLLVLGSVTMGSFMWPEMTVANPLKAEKSRTILLRHLHTGEELETLYFNGKNYIGDELRRLDYIFRDFRRNEVARIDRRLYHAISQIQTLLGHEGYAQIFSGYRSPSTNKMLAKRSSKVAKRSFHMQGRAIDFNLEGVPLDILHKAAVELNIGGVGYYPRSQFIHIDTGPVRFWRG